MESNPSDLVQSRIHYRPSHRVFPPPTDGVGEIEAIVIMLFRHWLGVAITRQGDYPTRMEAAIIDTIIGMVGSRWRTDRIIMGWVLPSTRVYRIANHTV